MANVANARVVTGRATVSARVSRGNQTANARILSSTIELHSSAVVPKIIKKQYRSHYNAVTLFIYEGIASVGVQEDEYKWTVTEIESDVYGNVLSTTTHNNVRWIDYNNL